MLSVARWCDGTGQPLRAPGSEKFRPPEGLVVRPLGVSLSAAGVEEMGGWPWGLGPLSEEV